jgi:hypothetical protein
MPIKPLKDSSLTQLLSRIENGRYGEIRSITPLSPTSIEIRLSIQDTARGYDWIDIAFVINGVSDAKLVNDNVLGLLDMRDGICAEIESGRCGLAVGEYSGRLNESSLYVIGVSMGYKELPFSG